MKQYIKAHEIANEVRMLRTQHPGAFVIVEGPVDARVYRTCLHPTSCRITIAYNKQNALVALSILVSAGVKGVLAIVDADFERILKNGSGMRDVFITDTHDLETMMWASSALGKILGEYCSPLKMNRFESQYKQRVQLLLLYGVLPLGYLRCVSIIDDLKLHFEELNFSKFIDEETLQIKVKDLVTTVRNKSQRFDLSEKDLLDRMNTLAETSADAWQMCCGPDLIQLLSIGLRKTLGSHDARDCNSELLLRSFRLAYDRQSFAETDLHQSLKTWEVENAPFRIV